MQFNLIHIAGNGIKFLEQPARHLSRKILMLYPVGYDISTTRYKLYIIKL